VWGGWARVFLRSKPGRRSEGQWEGEAKGVYSGYCRERARARPSSREAPRCARGRRLGLAGPSPPMSRADAGARSSEYIT
jgi:hypothetical protein